MLCFSKSAAAKQRMLNGFVPDVKMNRTYMQGIQTGYDLHPSPIKLLRKKGCWAKTAGGGKSVNSAISANCFPKVSKQEVAEHKTEWNLGKMCVFWQFGAKDRQFYTLLTQHCHLEVDLKTRHDKKKVLVWTRTGNVKMISRRRDIHLRPNAAFINQNFPHLYSSQAVLRKNQIDRCKTAFQNICRQNINCYCGNQCLSVVQQ